MKKNDFDEWLKKQAEEDKKRDDEFDHDCTLDRAASLSEAALEDAILEIDGYFQDVKGGGLTASEQKKYDRIKDMLEKAYDKLKELEQ